MVKTTTHPNPSTLYKTEATRTATPDGAADMRLIPLDQIEPSPLNVRKVATSASDDAELLVNIRETGIKQGSVANFSREYRTAWSANPSKATLVEDLLQQDPCADYRDDLSCR